MLRKNYLRRVARSVVALTGMTAIVSCSTDDILSVEDVDVARPGALVGASALPTVYAAALTDFAVAYAGSGPSEGHVNMTGVFTDEFLYAETFPTRVQWDRRSLEPVNTSTEAIFRNLMRAQATADLAARRYAEFGTNSATDNARRAEIYNVWGNIYLLAAETWCSGVPFSRISDTGELVYGQPQTTAQMFAIAQQKFDSAATFAAAAGTAGTVQGQVAAVGKGRTLMNLGQYAAAATAVASVPVTMRYDMLHSANSARQNNGLWSFIVNGRRWVVANNKGGTGAPFATGADPRIRPVRASATATGFDGTTPLIIPNTLVADRTVPTNVARGVEAQLILAEVAARNGDANYITILNNLRANTALYACPTQLAGCVAPTALAPLAAAATPAARLDQVIRERGFWLYGTSHRLGDFRRLVRNDARPQETVFPSGTYPLGGTYGIDVNFPIPQPDEAGNPNVKSDNVAGLCLDRRA